MSLSFILAEFLGISSLAWMRSWLDLYISHSAVENVMRTDRWLLERWLVVENLEFCSKIGGA